MKSKLRLCTLVFSCWIASISADSDRRLEVDFPTMMQQHMLANMRDHLQAINEILNNLAQENFDQAADIAENRLGMSSLKAHNAKRMAEFMPQAMQQAGTAMHHAASQFALKVQEEDPVASYQALAKITATCVACHSAFKIH